MFDCFNRNINYLRISVTDRCNLRCVYCMPEDGVNLLSHNQILTFEEIKAVVDHGVERGITKVRITGGEPLVRNGIENLIKMIAGVKGVEDLSMTTNGILLKKFAGKLADSGLHRINISLDTLDPEKFRKITRNGDIKDVLSGIEEAKRVGLKPLKVNCVIRDNLNEPDAIQVAKWAKENNIQARFIRLMDLHNGQFSEVVGGDGGKCSTCNRLRLTADGFLKPCLFSNIQFNVREHGIEKAFKEALMTKPECGTNNSVNHFYNIGG